MLPRLYLMRHGETEWSLNGRHTGRTDIALTAHGEEESRKLGMRLGGVGFSRVFTSPRLRARRTCELAGLGVRAEVEPDLAEWDYGDYEGLRSGEIQQQQSGWNIFRDGCPGGESPAQVATRADRLSSPGSNRCRAISRCSRTAISGASSRCSRLGLPVEQGERFQLSPASLSFLGHEHDRMDAPVMVRWNDAAGPL